MKQTNIRSEMAKIAEKYFDYMSQNYPVMCLSDEFHFFPRAEKSIDYPDLLDSLDEQKIRQDTSRVKKLLYALENIGQKSEGIEACIDFELLRESMSAFLREFERIKIWQKDPTLYLKIALLGTEHLITRSSFIKADINKGLLSRTKRIPQLLDEAKRNLKKIPSLYLETALEMTDSSIDYFKDFPPRDLRLKPALLKELNASGKKTLRSLKDFERFLKEKPASRIFVRDRKLLEDILKNSYSYKRGLGEIFEIAGSQYHKTLKELVLVAKKIHTGKRWQEVLAGYRLKVKNSEELLRLYSDQIEGIKKFLEEKSMITIPKTQRIIVKETPRFMIPVRASASYGSPAGDDAREPAFFYTTVVKPHKGFYNSLHIEYIFVTAHETYPGHHLLDSIRRSFKNPIRRQVESPLFYEGWASYAESLIDRFGYVTDPVQRLVGLRRQAWRAVRAMLDVGIRIDKLRLEDAKRMLKDLGYGPRIVKSMLRHYILTSGYQLCYTIGKFEIDRLKERFVSRLGLKKFHDSLLSAGEIPFDLLEKKLEAQTTTDG